MKKLLFCLFLLPASLWAFQKPAKAAASKDQGNLTLVCKIVNLPANFDSLTLYEYYGLAIKPVMRTGRQVDSSFAFVLPRSKARIYGVGWAENGLARVILGEEPAVTLWANAQYMDKARTVNSPANRAYEDMRKRTEAMQLEGETHRTAYIQAANEKNTALQSAITDRFVRLSKAKTRYLDSLKTANPLLWRSATLQLTHDPEALEAKGAVTSDALVKDYFHYANFSDRGYDDVPGVFDAFESYAKLLSNIGAEQAKALADAQLAKIPANSKAYRMALGGLVAGFKTGQSPLYPAYAQQYVAAYRNLSYGEVSRVEYELGRAGAFTPGLAAPDLSGPTPEGQTLALSQLRGKYVLVDFWASWCGPCRRENPNVKALYEKYSGKGFEVFGVSLDRERAPWLKAIEADGLTWKHISDLKGWNSEHAKIYSVTSIPQTVLLDREGRIVARNLRGEELKNKLADIFGE